MTVVTLTPSKNAGHCSKVMVRPPGTTWLVSNQVELNAVFSVIASYQEWRENQMSVYTEDSVKPRASEAARPLDPGNPHPSPSPEGSVKPQAIEAPRPLEPRNSTPSPLQVSEVPCHLA